MKKFWLYVGIYLLSFTWALPQNLVGLIGFIFFPRYKRIWYKGQIISFIQTGKNGWAFTAGIFIFTNIDEEQYKIVNGSGSSGTKLADHELGHAIPQSLIFGPTQLLLCTLPSVLWFNFFLHGQDYEKPYWEKTASVLGAKFSKYLDTL